MNDKKYSKEVDRIVSMLANGECIEETIEGNVGRLIAEGLSAIRFKPNEMYSNSSACIYQTSWKKYGLIVNIQVGHLFGTYTDISSYKGKS